MGRAWRFIGPVGGSLVPCWEGRSVGGRNLSKEYDCQPQSSRVVRVLEKSSVFVPSCGLLVAGHIRQFVVCNCVVYVCVLSVVLHTLVFLASSYFSLIRYTVCISRNYLETNINKPGALRCCSSEFRNGRAVIEKSRYRSRDQKKVKSSIREALRIPVEMKSVLHSAANQYGCAKAADPRDA